MSAKTFDGLPARFIQSMAKKYFQMKSCGRSRDDTIKLILQHKDVSKRKHFIKVVIPIMRQKFAQSDRKERKKREERKERKEPEESKESKERKERIKRIERKEPEKFKEPKKPKERKESKERISDQSHLSSSIQKKSLAVGKAFFKTMKELCESHGYTDVKTDMDIVDIMRKNLQKCSHGRDA